MAGTVNPDGAGGVVGVVGAVGVVGVGAVPVLDPPPQAASVRAISGATTRSRRDSMVAKQCVGMGSDWRMMMAESY